MTTFGKHLDASKLLSFTAPDARASIAMDRIDGYLSAARLQMDRFQNSLKRVRHGDVSALRQAFSELHFYLICWNSIRTMMDVVKTYSGFAGVKGIWRAHRKTLDMYGRARDHLEHFDERLAGKKRKQQLGKPWDLGNLMGDSFSVGGERVDVSPASLELLERVVADFTAEVRREGLTRYQEKRKSRRRKG